MSRELADEQHLALMIMRYLRLKICTWHDFLLPFYINCAENKRIRVGVTVGRKAKIFPDNYLHFTHLTSADGGNVKGLLQTILALEVTTLSSSLQGDVYSVS